MRCAYATLSPESSHDQLEEVLKYNIANTKSCCDKAASRHDNSCDDNDVDLESCNYVWDYLKYGVLNPTPEDLVMFSTKCHAAFPLAAAFHQKEADVPR